MRACTFFYTTADHFFPQKLVQLPYISKIVSDVSLSEEDLKTSFIHF